MAKTLFRQACTSRAVPTGAQWDNIRPAQNENTNQWGRIRLCSPYIYCLRILFLRNYTCTCCQRVMRCQSSRTYRSLAAHTDMLSLRIRLSKCNYTNRLYFCKCHHFDRGYQNIRQYRSRTIVSPQHLLSLCIPSGHNYMCKGRVHTARLCPRKCRDDTGSEQSIYFRVQYTSLHHLCPHRGPIPHCTYKLYYLQTPVKQRQNHHKCNHIRTYGSHTSSLTDT